MLGKNPKESPARHIDIRNIFVAITAKLTFFDWAFLELSVKDLLVKVHKGSVRVVFKKGREVDDSAASSSSIIGGVLCLLSTHSNQTITSTRNAYSRRTSSPKFEEAS